MSTLMSRRRAVIRRMNAGALLAVFLGLVGPGHAEARIVAPGGDINSIDPLTGVSLADRPELAGEIIAEMLIPLEVDFLEGMPPVVLGKMRTQVVRETVSGTLDFYYTLVDAQPADGFSVSGFKGFLTDVDFRTDLGPGNGATSVFRELDGDVLHFSFQAGGPTFVKTDATEFGLVGEARVSFDPGSSPPAVVSVFAPVSPTAIPLPPAAIAGSVGLGLAYIIQRRFRRSMAHG